MNVWLLMSTVFSSDDTEEYETTNRIFRTKDKAEDFIKNFYLTPTITENHYEEIKIVDKQETDGSVQITLCIKSYDIEDDFTLFRYIELLLQEMIVL